jgi:hypothetical protein
MPRTDGAEDVRWLDDGWIISLNQNKLCLSLRMERLREIDKKPTLWGWNPRENHLISI